MVKLELTEVELEKRVQMPPEQTKSGCRKGGLGGSQGVASKYEPRNTLLLMRARISGMKPGRDGNIRGVQRRGAAASQKWAAFGCKHHTHSSYRSAIAIIANSSTFPSSRIFPEFGIRGSLEGGQRPFGHSSSDGGPGVHGIAPRDPHTQMSPFWSHANVASDSMA